MTTRHGMAIGVGLAALVLAIASFLGNRTAPKALACPIPTQQNAKHPGMVWIPGGTFEMGGDVYPEEGPRRSVTVDGFWMDRHEVTNEEFAAFVSATNYVTVAEREGSAGAAVFVMPSDAPDLSSAASWWHFINGANWQHPGGPRSSIEGREQFPAVALAYEDIAAYAKWKGRSLPTEAQWEWAARAGKPVAERDQPKQANTWQGIFPVVNTEEDGFAGVAPVGCYEPNAFGLYDMIGNVWEWTADAYDADKPPARVIKGGSYLCAANYCLRYRPAARQRQEETLGASHLGFRTILNAPGP